MMDELLALPPKRPKNRKTGKFMKPRVFGYGSSTGYNTRWKTICKSAGIPYLSAHPAGRHGFFTELVVRQGVDPVTAAKAGRWSDPNLPMRIYAHAETDEADVRARFRTNHVQADTVLYVDVPRDSDREGDLNVVARTLLILILFLKAFNRLRHGSGTINASSAVRRRQARDHVGLHRPASHSLAGSNGTLAIHRYLPNGGP